MSPNIPPPGLVIGVTVPPRHDIAHTRDRQTAVKAIRGPLDPRHPLRARGSGLAAFGTKMGGVIILAAVAAAVAAPFNTVTALLGAVPPVMAIGLVIFLGVETSRKGLVQITAEELAGRGAGRA